MSATRPAVIGELMNHSYLRARKAWMARAVEGYQELARLQTDLGASYLTLNLDGTQKLPVTLDEMLAFLPRLVRAVQETTDLPISFDNPHVAFHREALRHLDSRRARGRCILNSLAVSRADVPGMLDLVAEHDLMVMVMASECQRPDGSHGAVRTADEMVGTAMHFARLLRARGVTNDRIVVDPGLCPIASDTQGGVNLALDGIRALRGHPDLDGIHISVGLSNFSIGSAPDWRVPLERAFLRLALDAGLDTALANPEKNTVPLPPDDPLVARLTALLQEGRAQPGEDSTDAGFRQLDALMALWSGA